MVESVPFSQLQPLLKALPVREASLPASPGVRTAQGSAWLPPELPVLPRRATGPSLALALLNDPDDPQLRNLSGVVLDFLLTTSGLVAHWKLNETNGATAADAAAGTHPGALTGSPLPSWTTGVNRGGALFSGYSRIGAANSPDLSLTGDMTVSFWMKKTALGANYARVVGKGGSYLRSFAVYASPGAGNLVLQRGDFTVYPYSNYIEVFSSSPINAGVWVHVAGVFRGSTGEIWINGVRENSVTRPNSPPASPDGVVLGFPGNYEGFQGVLDDVRIYNRALDTNEVIQLSTRVLVDAGADQSYSSPGTLTLDGSCQDYRNPPSPTLSTQWRLIEGPAGVSIANPAALNSAVTFGASGHYVFRLTASAGGADLMEDEVAVQIDGAPTDGLVAYWPLDETTGTAFADYSGNNHSGAALRSGQWTSGRIQGALGFSLANDHATTPDAPDLRLTNDMSIAFWMYRTGGAYDFQRLVGKHGVYLRNYAVFLEPASTGHVLFQQGNWTSYPYTNKVEVYSTSQIPIGSWTHVAAVMRNNTAEIWVNGTREATAPRLCLPPPVTTDPLGMGYANYNTTYQGKLDEVRLYNRALTAAEIAALAMVDFDNDGLSDDWERQYFGDLSHSATEDYDGDGRTNHQEFLEGTDPNDANDCEPVRIGHWKFNTANLAGEQGEQPLDSQGVVTNTSFDGNGVLLNLGTNARLRYREREASGKVNIVPPNLSVRFMFKPTWNSQPSGTGPGGGGARLWEYGNPDSAAGGMGLTVDPTGKILTFKTRDGAGREFTLSSPPTSPRLWGIANWQRIQITIIKPDWSAEWFVYVWDNETLLMGGATAAPLPVPPAAVRANGFCIGSSWDGTTATKQAGGWFDEFEIFNYDLGAVGALMNNRVFSADATLDPAHLRLSWIRNPSDTRHTDLRRKDGANWTTVQGASDSWSYSDAPASGQPIEYGLFIGGTSDMRANMSAGLNLPAVENRGRILLLIDNTLAAQLTESIAQLKQDLVGDGWTVSTATAPRHDNAAWTSGQLTNPAHNANCAAVKSTISSLYASSGDLKAVLLIGHVTVPYSGAVAEDGHVADPSELDKNHYGAWPCDGYYADLDTAWPDSTANYQNTFNPNLNNTPGDGKFDPHLFPSPIEIAVGRVDFDRMTSFLATTSEIDLIRRYLDKEHRYRHGWLVLPDRALVESSLTVSAAEQYFENVERNSSAWFGFDSGKQVWENFFVGRRSAKWAFLAGGGWPNAINEGQYFTADLVSREPAVQFYMLAGSWFCDWNWEDNLMRGLLATPNYGLASIWGRKNRWKLGRLALGATLGDCLMETVNANESASVFCRTTFLLGDPSLRTVVTPSAHGLVATSSGASVLLSWSVSPAPGAQYVVYRTANPSFSSPADFAKLTPSPISSAAFTDASAPSGAKVYQVRVVNKAFTSSGSFMNISQGAFVTVN